MAHWTPLMTSFKLDATTAYVPILSGSTTDATKLTGFEAFQYVVNSSDSGFLAYGFRVRVAAAPGTGNSYRFTLVDTNISSGITASSSTSESSFQITISDLETSGVLRLGSASIFELFAFMAMKVEKIGTPADVAVAASFVYRLDDIQHQVLPGVNLYTGADGFFYPSMAMGAVSTVAGKRRKIFMADGTLSAFVNYVSDGDGGDVWIWRRYRNGVVTDTGGFGKLRDAASPPDNLDVIAGDYIEHEWEAPTPPYIYGGIVPFRVFEGFKFYPADPNVGVVSGNVSPGTLGTKYASLYADQHTSTVETDVVNVAPMGMKLSKLYVMIPNIVGAGKTLDVSLFVNGVQSALTVSLSALATNSYDSTHEVAIAPGDTLSIGMVGSGSISLAWVAWGLQYTAVALDEDLSCTATIKGIKSRALNYYGVIAPPPSVGYAENLSCTASIGGTQSLSCSAVVSPPTTRNLLATAVIGRELTGGFGWDGPWFVKEQGN